MRTKPPCIKDGVPCARRTRACQDTCPEMAAYHADIEREKAEEKGFVSNYNENYYTAGRKRRIAQWIAFVKSRR